MKQRQQVIAIVTIVLFLTVGLISFTVGLNLSSRGTPDNSSVDKEKSLAEDNRSQTENGYIPTPLKYLHSSEKEVPDKTILISKQKEVLGGIEDSDFVKKTIHNIHLYFEDQVVEHGWFKRLSDPDNPAWQYLEKTGTIEIPGSEPGRNDIDAKVLIEGLEEAKEKITSHEELKDDITLTQELISYAVENHDALGIAYAHQVLHDLDYWVLNYPIYYPEIAPPDWRGVYIYFGVTKVLEGAHPHEIGKLLASSS